MKYPVCLVIILFSVISLEFKESFAWIFMAKSPKCHGNKPYYFGTTDLICMTIKGKKGRRRRAASRPTVDVSHRWIYYEGEYFEWGVGDKYYSVGNSAIFSDECKSERESNPAGYSQLSKDSLGRCARSYYKKYGAYHILSNNCHHFANVMSAILCDVTSCPSWCT